jgi:hypothetical protein
MWEPIVTMILGLVMWIPFINVIVGGFVWGTAGFWTGVIVTLIQIVLSDSFIELK